MMKLLHDCVDVESSEAWGELWLLYTQIAAPIAQQQLFACGFSVDDAKDVVMDTMTKLCDESCRRLRSFRGRSKLELCAWLRRIVQNEAFDWVRRNRERMQAMQPLTAALEDSLACPEDANIDRFLRDLHASLDHLGIEMSENELSRLRILAGIDPLPPHISDRTLRHWRQSLGLLLERLM